MKRLFSIILVISLLALTSCDTTPVSEKTLPEIEQTESHVKPETLEFSGLDDPKLLNYVNDSVMSDLEFGFGSDDYIVNNIESLYISKEYLEEKAYNSQENIYFGYSLSQLENQFEGDKYIFTLGEDNKTIVKRFEGYDDSFEKTILKNVAIGTGVILICVTVSFATAGAGMPAASMIFAASAKTATTFALSSSVISGAMTGVVEGIKTKNFDKAITAAALKGSEGFKWGAISGAVIGGGKTAFALSKASAAKGLSPRELGRASELKVLNKYKGSEEQISYLAGKEVPYGTPGATRPDVIRKVGNHIEAIEVKNYNLNNVENQQGLYKELFRQISSRAENLPTGSTQRIVLDVGGRGYSNELLNNVIKSIQSICEPVYHNIPVELIV